MKRDWLIFKMTVLVAAGAFVVSAMGRVSDAVNRWASRAMTELDKEAP